MQYQVLLGRLKLTEHTLQRQQCCIFVEKRNKNAGYEIHKCDFSWMKYGFSAAKRKVRPEKLTVNCIEARIDQSWEP